jgi:A/G-specific adenine glycosylase
MRKTETPEPCPRLVIAPTPARLVPLLLAWFAANARDLPWRRTHDPYAIWVSEIMLQQTQVKTVVPYWERWMRKLPTIKALAGAKQITIHKLWEGLGYYTRVRNLQKAAQHIGARHGGMFPEKFEDIFALPGIGRYTAGAIASIAFNQPTPILDGNVIRVLTRLHGIGQDPREPKTNARLWRLAEELVSYADSMNSRRRKAGPDFVCSHLNQSLMELGALICTPRSPNCSTCPVAKHCVAFLRNGVAKFPHRNQRAAITERRFIAFIVEQQGRFLVRQRDAKVVNAQLWEFPNREVTPEDSVEALAQKIFKSSTGMEGKLFEVKHSITRYRITTEAWRMKFQAQKDTLTEFDGVWKTRA